MPLAPKDALPVYLPKSIPVGLVEKRTKIGPLNLSIHYKANPDFRTPENIAKMKAGIPDREWEREYELDWSSVEGQPVFPDFSTTRHVADARLIPQPGSVIVVGIDPGLSPGAAITQKTVFGQVQLFRTLQPQQVSALEFGALLLANIYTEEMLRTLYPPEFLRSWPVPMTFDGVWPQKLLESVTPLCGLSREMLPVKYVGDPAGMQRNATAGKDSYFGILKKMYRLVIHKSSNTWASRVSTLTSVLLPGASTTDGDPLFIISGGEESRQDTEFIRDGLAGAYAYPLNMEQEQPPKGPHSHPVDALQYAVMEHYPQGAGRVYGASLTTNYSAIVGITSGSDASAKPQATVAAAPEGDAEAPPKPLTSIGENGLLTFSDNRPWNPFLDSFA